MTCATCGARIDMKTWTHQNGHCVAYLLSLLATKK